MATSKQTVIGIGCIAVLGVVLYDVNPEHSSMFPRCIFHTLTGLYCPGCGSTRALHQLLHGNVIAAFRYNQLTMLFVPFIVYALLSYLFPALKFPPLPSSNASWLIPAIIILYGVLRNFNTYPFSLLAPCIR
ncbi:MAG: DUF2752 domain-containing protein [Nitrospirae bacterium]|nr:DUF2752 domain-containing protein [Nitrospirota bacterium]